MKKEQWRKRCLIVMRIARDLIHRNLIAAYPERETWELKISADEVLRGEIAKRMKK